MPSGETKILKFNHYKKSDKASFVIYADLECLIEKIDCCKNNSQNSSGIKVGKYFPLQKINMILKRTRSGNN